MTGGEVGHPTLGAEEIRSIRLAEAAKAAHELQGTFHWAGGCDLEVEYSSTYRKLATRVIREVDPLIVLTHPPADYMPDHEQTSLLVRNAAYIASVPGYDRGSPAKATTRFPYLYYWNALGGTDIFGRTLPLTCAIDITSTMPLKERALSCHESQREWLRFLNGWDEYIENMRARSAEEGRRIGVPFAESFIQHRCIGHPKENILKDILGDLCAELPEEGRL
jgi:LmbE family N-acetylglucosaminyl deacetylase